MVNIFLENVDVSFAPHVESPYFGVLEAVHSRISFLIIIRLIRVLNAKSEWTEV